MTETTQKDAELFENALKKAEQIEAAADTFEKSRRSLEELRRPDANLVLTIKRLIPERDNPERKIMHTFELDPISQKIKEELIDMLEVHFIESIEKAKQTVKQITEPREKTDEEKLADMFERMKPKAEQKTPPKAAEKAAPKPSKDKVTDEELERLYFKEGLTVKQIAQKYDAGPAGLYKRIEVMRDKRFKISKECVSSQ